MHKRRVRREAWLWFTRTVRVAHLLLTLPHVLEVADNLVTQVLESLKFHFERLELLGLRDLQQMALQRHSNISTTSFLWFPVIVFLRRRSFWLQFRASGLAILRD